MTAAERVDLLREVNEIEEQLDWVEERFGPQPDVPETRRRLHALRALVRTQLLELHDGATVH